MKIRLLTYKSFRHYGGREITPTPHICEAEFVKRQPVDHTIVVKLLEDCGNFKKGHILAVQENDFDIKL